MRRRHRIALELLGPPLLGTVLFDLYMAAAALNLGVLVLLPVVLFAAIPLAGLQTLGFAVVMELAFSSGLDPRSWRSVLLATGLGAVSGFPVELMRTGGRPFRDAPLFVLLGLAVGFVIGSLIRRWSAPSPPSIASPSFR